MGIIDWFKNRPAQFDSDRQSTQLTQWAIDKAVTLTNPRLKLVHSYEERLAPAVETSVHYLRQTLQTLPAAINMSAANWSADPTLRAFFVAASDIPGALARSSNLHTLFNKFPQFDEAYFILGMRYNEQRVLGVSLQGDVVQREVAQTVVSFSDPQARICGQRDTEVRLLLATQGYEYLVAQALAQIGDDRSERRELEDNRALIRARLRLLQQQGPGLGSVFGSAPASSGEQLKLEAQLLENERQLETIGSVQSALDAELEILREVLANPQRYISVEKKALRLSTMNVVLDQASTDVASDVVFSLAKLSGSHELQRAFVMARLARSELPEMKMNFAEAQRYL